MAGFVLFVQKCAKNMIEKIKICKMQNKEQRLSRQIYMKLKFKRILRSIGRGILSDIIGNYAVMVCGYIFDSCFQEDMGMTILRTNHCSWVLISTAPPYFMTV